MAKNNWFTRALADIRREVVEVGFYGKPDAHDPGNDRVLSEKLHPDKSAERGFLGWLEVNHARQSPGEHDRAAAHPPSPDQGHDLER